MARISILGILAGGAADIVLSNIFGFAVLLTIGITHPELAGVAPEEMARKLTEIKSSSPEFMASAYGSGAIASIFGGFIAASIAKRAHILNGGLSAWACVLFGLYALLFSQSENSAIILFGIVASPILGMLGGYLKRPRIARLA